MPTIKPSCGCCSDDFEIISVKHKEGSVYVGQFDGCNVNPIVWVVRQGCVDFAAGDDTPRPGGLFDLDLNGVPDGNYEIFASSPNCKGYGRLPDGKTFAVTHNSGIVPDEEDAEPLATPSITATGINSNTIRINWAHPGGADEFQLQYLVGDTWTNVDGGTFAGTLRTADTTPWASNTQFSFRMRAKKGADYSSWSNEVSATAIQKNCQETLSTEKQGIFDAFATSNIGSYNGNFTALLYRNNAFYFKQIGAFGAIDPVHVASLSKQFAAALILILVEEGKFSSGLDTTVGSLISSMQSAGKGAIKLRHLMSHTSGMKAVSTQGYEDQSGITMQEAVDLIATNVPLEHTPGTYYEYGGVHWCIAARMAEVATGKSWVTLCQEKLWGPLGMDNTSYWIAPFPATSNPMIHAGLITSIADFGQFMQMRLKLGVYNGTRIMSEASVLSMETDQTGGVGSYGFGIYPNDGVENFHYGATSCGAWINRAKKYFGLVFTNVTGSSAATTKNDDFRTLVRGTLGDAPNCDDETTTDEEENPDTPPVTPNLNTDFVFLTNTTGYFDSNDFVDKITGLAPASRVVRWCVRWDEYETAPGVYRTDKIAARVAQVDAIYKAAGQPLPYYAINFWGVRHDDKIEQFIPARDVVKFQSGKRATGDVVINKCYGLGSFSSPAYRKRVADCGHSIVACGKEIAPGRVFYAAYSSGQTEERFNYLWDDPERPRIYESHGDFSDVAVDAFRIYCVHRYGTTTPWGEASASATIPTADWDTYLEPWVVSAMMGGTKGQAWTDFTNEEMEKTVIAFRNGCKSADDSVAVIDFIADFFRLQGNGWMANSISAFRLTAQLDGMYHSDGDTMDDDDYAKKYSSFDTMVPTWGADKLYFCELDYKDMYMIGTGLPSKDAIKRTARAVYRKGGKGIHFAMSMTSAQAAEASVACLEILAEIEAGTLVRLDRSSAPNFTYNLRPACYGGGDNLLNYYKSTAGGTETNVVNLKLIDNS
jgi:hypothetical protein